MRVWLLIMIIIFAYSCSKKQRVYRHLEGRSGWLIEAFYHNNQSVLTEYFGNAVDFYDDERCLIPIRAIRNKETGEIDWKLVEKEERNYGNTGWILIQKGNTFFIKFYTNDDILKDTFQVRFYFENGLNKMDLFNEKTYIKLSKWSLIREKPFSLE
jgi:hypothetical protein